MLLPLKMGYLSDLKSDVIKAPSDAVVIVPAPSTFDVGSDP